MYSIEISLLKTIHFFLEIYSLLKVELYFIRDISDKMAGCYLPSFLIIIISFTTFWLGLDSTSERVTIGITSVLALVTQFAEIRKTLPPVKYVSAVDVWMLMCMVFLAAQLIQTTVVHYMYEKRKRREKLRKTTKTFLDNLKAGVAKQDNSNPSMSRKVPFGQSSVSACLVSLNVI